MPAEKMTLEEIGRALFGCGCCVEIDEETAYSILRAADAGLARGREAEALLRRIHAITGYAEVADWLVAHPAKEDGR